MNERNGSRAVGWAGCVLEAFFAAAADLFGFFMPIHQVEKSDCIRLSQPLRSCPQRRFFNPGA